MSESPLGNLRLGARGSLLSRMQSQWVADALEKAHPGLTVELVLIKTTGDRITDRWIARTFQPRRTGRDRRQECSLSFFDVRLSGLNVLICRAAPQQHDR